MSNVEKYMQGWTTGDLGTIQDACAEDFVFDDPYDGRITKAKFPEYWGTHPGDLEGGFSDTVVRVADGAETGWAWWHWTPKGGAAEETQVGSVLMKGDADGLHSAQLAYYRR
jgi:hypothetical protein